MATQERISNQQGVEAEPSEKSGARNRFPIFLKRIEKWKAFAE
jgi:hypothetical protein